MLVTGGAGFIGSHVAEYFAKLNHNVIVYDNLSRAKLLGREVTGSSHNWGYLKQYYPRVALVEGDVRSQATLHNEALGADVIVHTGAQVAVTASLKDPKVDFDVNAVGTLNVLEAARCNDSTVIFCSTNKVYGENVNSIPIRELKTRYEYADSKFENGVSEDFPVDLTAHTPYGCSKLTADLYAQEYAHAYGLKTGVFRLSCVYGTRQYGNEDQGWVAWFARAALDGIPLAVYGSGKQVRDILWIDDLVGAFDLFLRSPSKHEVLNVGGGPRNKISLLELLDMLKAITGNEIQVSYFDWRDADQKVYVSNIKKAQQRTGWEPTIDPLTGIQKLVDWMNSNAHA